MNDENLNKKLLEAAKKDNLKRVKECLNQGAWVNCQTKSNPETPLMIACSNGNFEIAKELLDRGASPYLCSAGWKAIERALVKKRNDILELLLDFDSNNRNFDYTGGLFHLTLREAEKKIDSYSEHLSRVNRLIDLGANINARDDTGMTPLHWAIRRNNVTMTRILIDLGANLDTVEFKKCETPLITAIMECNKHFERDTSLEIAKFVIENVNDVNNINCQNETALMLAPVEFIQSLIDKGAEVNAKDINGDTALHCFSKHGKDDGINILLKNGAKINSLNDVGETPLMAAWLNQSLSAFKLLLNRGADASINTVAGKNIVDLFNPNKSVYIEILNSYAEHEKLNDIIKTENINSEMVNF